MTFDEMEFRAAYAALLNMKWDKKLGMYVKDRVGAYRDADAFAYVVYWMEDNKLHKMLLDEGAMTAPQLNPSIPASFLTAQQLAIKLAGAGLLPQDIPLPDELS